MFVHQTLAEFMCFFHQPMNYPNLEAVNLFLGNVENGEAFEVLHEALYERLRNMLPDEIEEAFGDGVRFEHPLTPAYYEPAGDVTQPILAADQILTFAQADAMRAYGDLSDYSVRLSLEGDGWHVDYELRHPHMKGGGPHYVLDPMTGAVLTKCHDQ